MTGDVRISEAREGIDHLRREIADWVAQTGERGLAGSDWRER